jgi:hypothetical protein
MSLSLRCDFGCAHVAAVISKGVCMLAHACLPEHVLNDASGQRGWGHHTVAFVCVPSVESSHGFCGLVRRWCARRPRKQPLQEQRPRGGRCGECHPQCLRTSHRMRCSSP